MSKGQIKQASVMNTKHLLQSSICISVNTIPIFITVFRHVPSLPRVVLASSHPNLPGAVTFNQLEVLAHVVVGAEAHFEDLDRPPVASEGRLSGVILAAWSWTGHLPGQGVTGHHLIHSHEWVGIMSSSLRQTKEKGEVKHRL